MQRYFVAVIIIIFTLALNGCSAQSFLPHREEIQDLEMVRIIGIDKSPDNPDEIRLTLISKIENQESSGKKDKNSTSSQGGKSKVISSDGKTAFEAARKFQTFNDKRVFWGQVEYFIIGEQAAREDLVKYLDFISRGQELRINIKVYVVKNSTAQDFLEISKSSSLYIPDALDNLSKDIRLNSTSGTLEQIELMNKLDNQYSGLIIPALNIITKISSQQGESDEKAIELNGYGIFKNHKLIDFSNMQQSIGINLITNKFESGFINVKDSTGKDVALEVTKSDANIIPDIKDKNISVLIKTSIKSNIAEMHSTMNIFKQNELQKLQKQQSAIIKQYIIDAINLAQNNGTDVLDIADKIHHKDPVKWESIKDNWKETFPKIKFNVQVDSELKITYEIRQPNANKDGE